MKSKSSVKKTNITPRRKKIGLSQLILIILTVIIALSFLVSRVYKPVKKKPSSRQKTAISNSAPSFRKDGNLSILTSQNSSVIKLDIEIADNENERMRGLMDRHTLPENAGMLFIFDQDEPRSFWMKNTYIPLDIIYINSKMEIVSIQEYTQPKTTFSIPSEKPAMFVLEVNAGFSEKYGIKPGDKIGFKIN
jgi:uncharacterized protein